MSLLPACTPFLLHPISCSSPAETIAASQLLMIHDAHIILRSAGTKQSCHVHQAPRSSCGSMRRQWSTTTRCSSSRRAAARARVPRCAPIRSVLQRGQQRMPASALLVWAVDAVERKACDSHAVHSRLRARARVPANLLARPRWQARAAQLTPRRRLPRRPTQMRSQSRCLVTCTVSVVVVIATRRRANETLHLKRDSFERFDVQTRHCI
jgi:hypothetical protein